MAVFPGCLGCPARGNRVSRPAGVWLRRHPFARRVYGSADAAAHRSRCDPGGRAGADRRLGVAALAPGPAARHAARPPQEDPGRRRRRPRPAKSPRHHRPAPDRERSQGGRLRTARQARRDRAARTAAAGPQPVHRHARPARRDPPPPAGAARDGRQGRRSAPRGRARLHRDPRPPEPARTRAARPRDRRPQEQSRRPAEGHRPRRVDAAGPGQRGAGHLLDAQSIQGGSGKIPRRAGAAAVIRRRHQRPDRRARPQP